MTTPSIIRRPYIAPAIEEVFDCETEDMILEISVKGVDVETGEGDWDVEAKSTEPSSFNLWENDDDYEDY